jgi:hypothetical protein
MGRGPLLKRQLHRTKRLRPCSQMGRWSQTLCVMRLPLTAAPVEAVVLCGISSPFEELFPTRGQVTHVLLTRAPLYSPSCPGFRVRLACVRHAVSVRSEPGSNSPNEPVCLKGCADRLKNPLFSCQRAFRALKRTLIYTISLLCQALFPPCPKIPLCPTSQAWSGLHP